MTGPAPRRWWMTPALMAATLVVALSPASSAAADSAGGPGSPLTPSFDVTASAAPILVHVSAPSALPLTVDLGAIYSGVALNSQPSAQGEAGPGYAPLAGSLGLLGGAGALPQIGARLLPGLIVGLPTVFGLPPVPVPPPAPPDVPVLPAPAPPPVECFSYYPGDPHQASCGGPTQSLFGFDMRAASAATTSNGDPIDTAQLASQASATGAGFVPSVGNSLVPLSVGAAQSAATSSVIKNRITAGASTAIQDISIAGVIDIPSLRTSLSGALGGTANTASSTAEHCTVAGATVAGVPVNIAGDGIHAAGQNTGLPTASANALVQQTLTSLGVTLRTLTKPGDFGTVGTQVAPGSGVTVAADGTSLSGGQACLEVTYKIPTSGSVVTVRFGSVALKMTAFPQSSTGGADGSGTAGAGAPDASGGLSGGSTTPPASDGGSLATAPSTVDSALPPPLAPTPGLGAGRPSTRRFLVQGAASHWRIPFAPLAILLMSFPLVIWTRRLSFGPVARSTSGAA